MGPTVAVILLVLNGNFITGADLVVVDGLSEALAQSILSEMVPICPNDKHFASWLGLAPQNDISGGKLPRSHTSNKLSCRSSLSSGCHVRFMHTDRFWCVLSPHTATKLLVPFTTYSNTASNMSILVLLGMNNITANVKSPPCSGRLTISDSPFPILLNPLLDYFNDTSLPLSNPSNLNRPTLFSQERLDWFTCEISPEALPTTHAR